MYLFNIKMKEKNFDVLFRIRTGFLILLFKLVKKISLYLWIIVIRVLCSMFLIIFTR